MTNCNLLNNTTSHLILIPIRTINEICDYNSNWSNRDIL
jgi:hypothetical protein